MLTPYCCHVRRRKLRQTDTNTQYERFIAHYDDLHISSDSSSSPPSLPIGCDTNLRILPLPHAFGCVKVTGQTQGLSYGRWFNATVKIVGVPLWLLRNRDHMAMPWHLYIRSRLKSDSGIARTRSITQRHHQGT